MTAPTFGDIGDGEKVGAALSTDRERPRFYRTPSKTNLDGFGKGYGFRPARRSEAS